VHTDRGSQYVSDQYIELLKKHELTASMSAKVVNDNYSSPAATIKIPHLQPCK